MPSAVYKWHEKVLLALRITRAADEIALADCFDSALLSNGSLDRSTFMLRHFLWFGYILPVAHQPLCALCIDLIASLLN